MPTLLRLHDHPSESKSTGEAPPCKSGRVRGGGSAQLLIEAPAIVTDIFRRFTQYVQADANIVCRIWGFHGGDYEEYRLMGCVAV
jgi:hypothetical protein